MAQKIRSPRKKRDKENVLPSFQSQHHNRASNTAGSAEELFHLKRYIGNQTMQSRMQQRDKELETHPLQSELSHGTPLGSSARTRMESAFGTDFSDVRLHTDAHAAGMARSHDSFAFTAGKDIVFNSGNYQPGTLTGDTLLAHELAHTVQQDSSNPVSDKKNNASQERGANRSAFNIISSLWQGVKDISSHVAQTAGPVIRSGIQLQRCARTDTSFEPPAFLGPHSRATLERIRALVETLGLAQDALEIGPLIVLFSSPPTGYHLAEQAQAVAGIDPILRNEVMLQIIVLENYHGNDLTAEERAYWENIRRVFNQ